MRCKNYFGYTIYENGDIYGKRIKHKLLKTYIGTTGYYTFKFCYGVGQIDRKVHRVIAELFIPNPENKPCINHKDANKLNNNIDNLEWYTHKENSVHAKSLGLFQSQKGSKSTLSIPVYQYDSLGVFINKYDSHREASRITGIREDVICRYSNKNKLIINKYKIVNGFIWLKQPIIR